ncbi:TIM barrel protein [Kineococcus sp. SYSU DK002]|uniref:TIM barrel protein n=1 Tax=Kineococcus sp. SYSU DK002 TaxID=3383123 RepID=UPI003D7EEE00
MTGRWIAGAPVSFGVWGPHAGAPDGDGDAILGALAAAGYAGSELGDTGFLGDPGRTADAFGTHRLAPAGVYVGLPLARGEWSAPERAGFALTCRTLRAAVDRHALTGDPGAPAARIVLADDGAPGLDAPRDPADRASGLGDAAWARAVDLLAEAAATAAGHGLATTFHPHLGTYVESTWEVDRLLATTPLTVTLDTGHALLAGTDPVGAVARWAGRIDHVHLKDVRLDVPRAARRGGPVPLRDWWADANVPFGAGDVDLAGVLRELRRDGYAGWLVVEQDAAPHGGPQLARFAADQEHNLRVLRGLLDDRPGDGPGD